jgi:hypothetical protein
MRAFLHEVRTFSADPKNGERLGNIRQLMETDQTARETDEEHKAA